MAEKRLTGEQQAAYWHKTRNLMWVILAAWFIFSFAVHFFAPELNKIHILGFPLGYYMAAQGSLIAFVLMCIVLGSLANRALRTMTAPGK